MRLSLFLLVVGAALVVIGVALLSVPVSLIVAGAAISSFALLRDGGGR